MSQKEQHLEALQDLNHTKAKKARLGCVAPHEAKYDSGAWPDCNYRKNAHQYSIGNDTDIYNVPTLRSPVRWLEFALQHLEPILYSQDSKNKAMRGQVRRAGPPSPLDDQGCWDLLHTIADPTYNALGSANFHDERVPYSHNTHHVFACDEIYRAFTYQELEILVLAEYNINRVPNLIILPTQRCVAWALKLPVHCPDQKEHPLYSQKVRTKLADIKGEFLENAEETGHKLTKENAPNLVKQMEDNSRELRQYLIDKGLRIPGINLNQLSIP